MQVPLRTSLELSEQVVQSPEVVPEQVEQLESQAETRRDQRAAPNIKCEKPFDSPTQLRPSSETEKPVGQLLTQAPSTRYDPARQAEHLSCDRVEVELKLSMAPAVHLAGRAVRVQ